MARKTVKRYGNTYIYEDGKLVQTIRGNSQKKGESGGQGQAVVTKETYKKQTKPASSSNITIQKPKDSVYTKDPTLNRRRGVKTWTQRMNEKYNNDWNSYQESLKSVSVDGSKYDSYVSSGKAYNKLRNDGNDYDEGTLEFFDMLYGSGNTKKADEGAQILQNIYKNSDTYNKNIEGYSKDIYKTYEREIEQLDKDVAKADKRLEKAVVQEEYRKGMTGMMSTAEEAKLRRESLQQRLADAIANGNYEDQAQIRAEIAQAETVIANTDAEKARAEMQDRRQERAGLVVADRDLQSRVKHENEYANMSYNDRLESVERGKAKDKYLVNDVDNPVAYIAETGSTTEDFDLKTASMFMTSVEKNKYYTVLDKYGEEEALNYLKALYTHSLGDRVAKALAEETNDSKYGFAFGFGVVDAARGIGDTFSSLASDDVKVESLTKKTFNAYLKNGNDMLAESLYSIGNMVPAILASVASAGIGAPTMVASLASSGTTFASVYGQTYYDTRRQGYTTNEASAYAMLTAGSEAGLQYALSGVSTIAGGKALTGLKGASSRAIARVAKNPVARYALTQITAQSIDSSGEFTEEYLQAILEPVYRNLVLGEDNLTDPFMEEKIYQGIMGALTANLTNSVTITGDTVSFGKQQRQISQLIEEAKALAPTTDAFNTANWLEQNAPDADNVALLMKQMEQAEIDENSIKQFLYNEAEWNDISDTGRSMLVNPQNAEYISSKFGIDINSEMTPMEIKEAVKAVSEENKTAAIDYANVVTDEKVLSLYESVEKNTGIKIRVQTLAEGIQGYVSEDGIVINRNIANTEDGARFVISHELTHGTESSEFYNDLQDNVKEFYGENFDTEVQNRIDTYAKHGITLSTEEAQQEVVADFVASEIFTDYNKLKRFVDGNRTLAQKVFDWIKTQIKKLSGKNTVLDTAYSNFEKAFKDVNVPDETKFSYSSSLNKMTEKSYNRGAWALANEIITRQESAEFYKKVGDIKKGEYYAQTKEGAYIIPVNNKLIFTQNINNKIKTSDYVNVGISAVYVFNERINEDIEVIGQILGGKNNDRVRDFISDYVGSENFREHTTNNTKSFSQFRSESNTGRTIRFSEENNGNIEDEQDGRRDNREFKYSIKQADAQYTQAIENGDLNTAQTLVDEAAREAGFTEVAYHGTTQFGFTVPDTGVSEDGITFYATDSLDTAGTYSATENTRAISERSQTDTSKIEEAYNAKLQNFVSTVNKVAGSNLITRVSVPVHTRLDAVKKGKDGGVEVANGRDNYINNLLNDVFYNTEAYDRYDTDSDFLRSSEARAIRNAATSLYATSQQLESAYKANRGNYKLYVNTDGLLEVDAKGSRWNNIQFNGAETTTKELAQYAKKNGYKGVKITNITDDGGIGNKRLQKTSTVYTFFDPQTQIKSADNITYDDNGDIIPLSKRFNLKNNDIRYSVKQSTDIVPKTEEKINELVEEYGAKEKGLKKGVVLPKKTSENKTLSDLAVSLLSDPDLSAEAKQRLRQGVVDGDLSYIPITNKSLEAKANEIFKQKDNDLNRVRTEEWQSVVDGNSRFTPEKSVLAITLYNEYLKAGDTQSAYEVALELRSFATEAGQTVQSLSMLNKITPDGQLYSVERSLARMNKKWKKQYKGFEGAKINEALAKKLLEAKTEEEISAVRNEIIEDIATQVPANWFEKMQAWRRVAMLLNPITHARNIAGNAVSIPARELKDLIGVGIENIAEKTGYIKKEERTKSVLNPFSKTDKKYIDAGKESYNSIKDILKENNKSEEMAIQRKKRIFKNKIGEFLRKVNFTALAAEDALFSKLAYTRAYAKAVKARGLNPEAMSKEDDIKISEYAIEQALKATYRESNAVANALEKFKRLNAATYVIGEGMMPFVKTPMNIMKQGVEFSPIGVIKGITDMTVGVKNGKHTAAQAIDNLATGLSGTAIMAIGAFLASQGLLSGGDDEEDQNYALVIGDKSYTLDWAMPVAMPLFMGVEVFNAYDTGDVMSSFKNMIDGITKISEPLFNFTVLSSINKAIKNSSNSNSPMVDMVINLMTSYAGQYVPSVFGSVARVIDDTKRTTYYQPNSNLPYAIDSFVQGILKKVAPATLQPKLDRWGNEVKSGNVGQRVVENMLSPGYYSEKPSTNVDVEIDKMFLMTGDDSVIPPVANKKYTINGKEHVFNAQEYTKFSKVLGHTAYKAVEEIINSNEYKFMLPSEKVATIKTAYDFAQEKAKAKMFKDYQPDRVSQAMLDGKFSVSEYAYYKAVTDSMTGANISADKKNVLASMDLSESAKQNIFAAVYEDKSTKDRKSIDTAVEKGVSAESFIKASSAMSSLSKKYDQTMWIKNNSKNSKEIVGLHESFIESDKTDYRDSISYAETQGINPKTYLQREIEIAELSNDKTQYTDEDVIYENDRLVEFTEEKEKSKNTKIMHAETLLTGGYTEDEILFFWQKEYPDDDSFSYVASVGLKPSAYVDFKAQTFKADVDENGKAITGTKKAKIASYINKMNISETQKLILKMSVTDYTYETDEYQRVIDYVNARPISKKDKLDILGDIGLKIVNGVVYPQKN